MFDSMTWFGAFAHVFFFYAVAVTVIAGLLVPHFVSKLDDIRGASGIAWLAWTLAGICYVADHLTVGFQWVP